MKIYFTASARGKKKYLALYQEINDSIEKLGHQNLDNLLFKLDPKEFYTGDEKDQQDLYKNTLDHIKRADIIILEISLQSLSMGFIIDRALKEGKPIILLYHESEEINPFFVQGIQEERLQVIPYNEHNIKETLQYAIKDAKDEMDVRFNFFVSPGIVTFLDWISSKKKMPRAVYLRRLIEKDMEKNKEFSKEEA